MNPVLTLLLNADGWGRHVRQPFERNSMKHMRLNAYHAHRPASSIAVIIAWVLFLGSFVLMIPFYILFNEKRTRTWFILGLIQDGGVSFIGLLILVLSPLEIVIRQEHKRGGHRDSKINTPDHAASEELPILAPTPTEGTVLAELRSYSTNSLSGYDTVICVHVSIFILRLLVSCIADVIVHMGITGTLSLYFVFGDLVSNLLYGCGFFVLAVCFRVVALRVHALTKMITDACPPKGKAFIGTKAMRRSALALRLAGNGYEEVYEDVEELNDKTSLLALAMVSLAAMEMATIMQTAIEGYTHKGALAHTERYSMMRLVLTVGIVVLQFAFSAADVAHASEHLAEACSRFAWAIRQRIVDSAILGVTDGERSTLSKDDGDSSYMYGATHEVQVGVRKSIVSTGVDVSSSNDGSQADRKSPSALSAASSSFPCTTQSLSERGANLDKLARSAEVLAGRVRWHTVRVSVAWVYMTPEWATGISLLVATMLLAIAGIRLPLN